MRIFLSVVFALIIGINFYFGTQFFSDFEAHYNNEIFHNAVASFALAKVFNAIISVLQSVEISASFFVGFNVQIGEILDPLNDLIERFSWVMLFASVSLGVQKLLLIFGKSVVMQGLVFLLSGVGLVMLWVKQMASSRVFSLVFKVLVLLLVMRFEAVVFSYGSEQFYQHFYAKTYTKSMEDIRHLKNQYQNIEQQRAELQSLKSQSQLNRFLTKLEHNMEHLSQKIVNLITVFVVTTVLFPLLFLYFTYLFVRFIFKIEGNDARITQIIFQKVKQ